MDASELQESTCPKCGQPMSHGYIAGHWFGLRWTDKEKTYTVLSGDLLRKSAPWLGGASLEAVRCETCKIGLFRYDY